MKFYNNIGVMAMYKSVPDHIKEDILEALIWAKTTLTNHEGSGHIFYLYAEDNSIGLAFSKPSWSGEHTSTRKMETASETVVMTVCEYLNGC